MTQKNHPLESLREGCWFKLICGASYQHLPAVRNLTLAYALAGADCIDLAADPAVVWAAREALAVARELNRGSLGRNEGFSQPWLMVSFNDGEDPHFRKALFESQQCPPGCWRPCEQICPAQAIAFTQTVAGVIEEKCYGCGRCIPVCPSQLIVAQPYQQVPDLILPDLIEIGINAIEIHTQVGHEPEFRQLWQSVKPWIEHLQLVAISCPDAEGTVEYLQRLWEWIEPLPCPIVWQTDGRAMSGDIGAGTTHASIRLAQKVLAARLPGFVQLAGGTNDYTVRKLRALGLLNLEEPTQYSQDIRARDSQLVAGIAYGSYARVLLSPILEELEARSYQQPEQSCLEAHLDLLTSAVALANTLVSQLKSPMNVTYSLP